MFAIVDIAGFQEKVEKGQIVRVQSLKGKVGDAVSFDKVLLVSTNGEGAVVGKPYVAGAMVKGTIKSHGRDEKIYIRKFKRRKRYRRVQGHRQNFTEVEITGVEAK